MQKDELFAGVIQFGVLVCLCMRLPVCHPSTSCSCLLCFSFKSAVADIKVVLQIEKEFPQILSIHDSLKKFVFEPNAKNKPQVLAAVKEMRGR